MNKFSANSLDNLNSCEPDLMDVFLLAIQRSCIDFGVSEGHRSVARQQALYEQGRTKPGHIVTYIDGINKKSKHNEYPSKAADIFAWVSGKVSYEVKDLCYIAGVVMSCAQELAVDMRWGGNWDRDGIIIADQNFIDLPHFEILS